MKRNVIAITFDSFAMNWNQALSDFVTYLRAAGRSRGTVRLRRYWVLRLAEACEGGPGEVTGDDLAEWLAGTDWSPNTRCSARASVRAFYRWAQQTGRREDNPTDALLTIAATPGRPRPCPESALLTAVRAAGDRERLMLALGACAGLRRAEIATCRTGVRWAGRVGRPNRRPPQRGASRRTCERAATQSVDHSHAASQVRVGGVPRRPRHSRSSRATWTCLSSNHAGLHSGARRCETTRSSRRLARGLSDSHH